MVSRIVISVLAVLVLVLLWLLLRRRYALHRLTRQLDEKLSEDTNILLTVSGRDAVVCRLADRLNGQLRLLDEERRKYQNGDAQLQRAITNISHDLRTPLTAVSGYLELLEQADLKETERSYLAVMRERTDSMKTLTEELFRYSVRHSVEELHLEAVDLCRELEDSLVSFYASFTERGITPQVEMPEQSVLRQLDRTAMRRVLENILGNALKYSDGDLVVTLTESGKCTFSNHAERLDGLEIERLFDRFYTVENVNNATGLGLSIARTLTKQMGGTIQAHYADGRLTLTLQF